MRLVLSLVMLFISMVQATAQDAAGCKDHPLLSRYPGAVLQWCEEQNHVEYAIARGPVTGYKQIDQWTEVRGKRTRLYYSIQGTTSIRDLYVNHQAALKRAGATILAEGQEDKATSKEVGGRTFLGVHYGRNEAPPSAGIRLLQGSATSGGSFYLAGTLNDKGTTVHLIIAGSQYTSEEKVLFVDIIEEVGVDTDKVKVNAEWMKLQIERYGKVAINDILFDTDKATIQAASMPVVGEVAKLMGLMPELRVHVVGHTDMSGSLEHNLDLSKRRSAEVVRVLTTDHAVAATRMEAHGVGPLAPVSTNKSDAGRQLNRRVELVAR